MAKGEILGRIDCPVCGQGDGVRVTHDRNGEPFGFCDGGCGLQLRIGGNAGRVRQFIGRFPWAGTVTGTGTEPARQVAPVREAEPEKPAAPVQEPPPKKKGSGNALLDLINGVQ